MESRSTSSDRSRMLVGSAHDQRAETSAEASPDHGEYAPGGGKRHSQKAKHAKLRLRQTRSPYGSPTEMSWRNQPSRCPRQPPPASAGQLNVSAAPSQSQPRRKPPAGSSEDYLRRVPINIASLARQRSCWVFSLNLSGLFEFSLLSHCSGGKLRVPASYAGSFFSGILMVVSTPLQRAVPVPRPRRRVSLPSRRRIGADLCIHRRQAGRACPLLSLFPPP